MTGISQSLHYKLHEYGKNHQKQLRMIRSVMIDCTISSIALQNNNLVIHYNVGASDIIDASEFEDI